MSINIQQPQITISIVTATFNAAGHLPRLIASLRAQTDKAFEWVVSDGASTDSTIDLLSDIYDLNIVLDSRPDFGIYDALNRAIKLSKGEYYLVLGADDMIYPDTISSFRRIIETSTADLITARVFVDGQICNTRRSWSWLYGAFAYISSHAVGTLIRKSLHQHNGMYSTRFPIAADQFFIKKACENGAEVLKANFVSGEYSTHGTSGVDIVGTLSENFRVQLLTGENRFIQVIILFLRLIKNYQRL